ncbi:MAG: hypothetical protein ABIH11_02505 [Candidatus Altiarchaeota archaeon]
MEFMRFFATITLVLTILSSHVSAARVLFYEVGTADEYKIEKGYSEFAKSLQSKGYTVASITRGELTKDSLANYDILVVQQIGKNLETAEISSIIWFVLQQGKGLFINGAGDGRANQLSIPFGVTVDSGILIDTEDQIGENRNHFTVNRFGEDPEIRTLKLGVTKVGVYGSNGFVLSGNTLCVLKGDDNTYSDTGSFPAGSSPCIAASSLFGDGVVFVLGDSDILSDKNIKSYNNKNFGLNIIDWLSIPSDPTPKNQSVQTLQIMIGELKLENAKLGNDIETLKTEKGTLEAQQVMLTDEVTQAKERIFTLENQMIGPFTKTNWAVIILGLCVIMAAVIISKKRAVVKPIDTDVLGELGYELEGGSAGIESPPKSGGGDSLEDDLSDLGL